MARNKCPKFIDKALIKSDFYTTSYFLKTANIIEHELPNQIATIQFKTFTNEPYMVCGVYESIEIIKAKLSSKAWNQIKIHYLPDGTVVTPGKCVLSITGPYQYVCCLENIIDGVLARRSSVANNCYQFLKLLKPEQLIFMGDRSDDYHILPYDGYAAYVGGIRYFSNQAHVAFIPNQADVHVTGTIPHALIQQFNGDIAKVYEAYTKYYPNDVTMLVDYQNDTIATLEQLKPYFNNISAVRIDTSKNMLDKSLQKIKHTANDYGSSHKLICLTRKWLDQNNGKHIKIICSSSNSLHKVQDFIKQKTPVDYYGIGSALTKLNLHFTADLVQLNNKNQAKEGRSYISTKGMKEYK